MRSQSPATLAALAELTGGELCGDGDLLIAGVAGLDRAGPEELSFLANPKYRGQLERTRAGAIIVHPSLAGAIDKPLLLCANPYLAFARVLGHFNPPPAVPAGVRAGATVDPTAQVAADAAVSPGCVIGAGAVIGAGTILHPNVVIYPGVKIGSRCTLHAGVVVREDCVLGDRVIVHASAVIGADGFGYAPDGPRYFKVPQVGRVVIEDDVEIGACATVDRGTLGDTRIGRGSKIDNLVQVAHNVQLGEDCIMVAQSGIAGSTVVGRHCTFGGQAAAAGHLKIGDNVTIAARGGVSGNVESNQVMAGFPLQPHREWLKSATAMTHLPELRRELYSLRQRLQELEEKFSKERN